MVRLSAPSVRTISSTPCCQSRTDALGPLPEVARGAAEVATGVLEQVLPGLHASARTPRRARRRSRRARGSASPARTRPRRSPARPAAACRGPSRPRGRAASRPWSRALRSSSPVPTNSCQRASTSPRSRRAVGGGVVDLRRSPRRRRGRRPRGAASPSSAWSPAASAMSWVRRDRERTAPSRVCFTTAARAVESAARLPSHERISCTCSGGSSPSSSTTPSVTANSGESRSPRAVSIRARWPLTSATASGGVRSRTIATAVLRSAAALRNSHGTWSA